MYYVKIDPGAAFLVNKIKVWHFTNDGRPCHGTKTQVGEREQPVDGIISVGIRDDDFYWQLFRMDRQHHAELPAGGPFPGSSGPPGQTSPWQAG